MQIGINTATLNNNNNIQTIVMSLTAAIIL
eukprot:COSAG05_NODE_1263_length_5338_cov_44.046956_1_plen_29_part_10